MQLVGDIAYLGEATDEVSVQEMSEQFYGGTHGWKQGLKNLAIAKEAGEFKSKNDWEKDWEGRSREWNELLEFPWLAYRYAMEVLLPTPSEKRKESRFKREVNDIEKVLSGKGLPEESPIGYKVPIKDWKKRLNPAPGIAYLFAKNFVKGRWEPGEYMLNMGVDEGQPEWKAKYDSFISGGQQPVLRLPIQPAPEAPRKAEHDPSKIIPPPSKIIPPPKEDEGSMWLFIGIAVAVGGLAWYFWPSDGEGEEV
tara:strand:- start:1 stop:756 length:756 start_codon:yes stop_codon:yes gene_type:complete